MIMPFPSNPSQGHRWVELHRSDIILFIYVYVFFFFKCYVPLLQKPTGDEGLGVKYMVFFTPEEKVMEVTEAQNLHMITTTPTRLFLRTSATSSETFTQDVSKASPGLQMVLL